MLRIAQCLQQLRRNLVVGEMWSLFKRGLYGTYHHMRVKHLNRCLAEFWGRGYVRALDTSEQMERLACGLNGRKLTWKMLVGSRSVVAPA